MASPSSSKPRNYKFKVFCSFHGPDVRRTFLSHLREQFQGKGITMFDDEKIKRGGDLSPSLKEAIKESRISIVILSKKYASSSWCLDELLEILKRKKVMKQIVMTVFYGVEPSDVRKQTGDFGIAFDETCAIKADKERLEWSKALTDVSNIAGEDFKKWDNEANMIKKIARDVSDQLNATPSKDFEDMVGLEAHLKEMESLLDLDNVGVKIVAISGPAGIGKTTIARALQSLLSKRFQLTCFVDNLRGSYHSGFDEYGLKLHLQEQFLSKVLNQSGMRICHLGAIKENLSDQRVLIILDDVNNLKQLEALANEPTWFGPGSRVVVTTENKELLQQHDINSIYHVGFPSDQEALKILCRYAFRQPSPRHGFKELAETVTELCGKLPLGLCVVGSSLRGKKEDKWEDVVRRLETILDRNIEDVLRVGYESLDDNEQTLFLHIAVFFNNINNDLIKTMFADSNLDVNYGLKILENRSLIEISSCGDQIVMHRLLQQVGKKAIHKQEPWKRQILIDAHEICDVLENAKGNRAVSGISFDISNINEVYISKKAFKRMPNLRFLIIYKSRDNGNYRIHIPEEMEFPRRLRLLDWKAYPSKSFPPTFNPEYLVELNMQGSQLEKLWEGIQPLKNLKYMVLSGSKNLKELPDLSNATNLEYLFLEFCESLVEIPSSFSHLHKLKELWMKKCINLQVIPAHMNLASLEEMDITGCSRLRNIPLLSTNIKQLDITAEDVPPSIRFCSCLTSVFLRCSEKLKELTHLPKSVRHLYLSWSDIERIPDCFQALHNLQNLNLGHCRRLTSLPELPGSPTSLKAENCKSLKTKFFPWSLRNAIITNCIKLHQQEQRGIIRRSFCYSKTSLPGREVPAGFDNRARGSSLTIVLNGNRSYSEFVFCVVFSPNQRITKYGYSMISWRRIIAQDDGYPVEGFFKVGKNETEHILIFHYRFKEFYRPKVIRKMMFKFSSESQEIIECGAKILTQEESIEWNYESGSYQASEDNIEFDPSEWINGSGSDQASEDDTEFESSKETFEDDIEFEPSEEAFEDNTEYGDPTNIDGEKQTDCLGISDFYKKRRKLSFEEENRRKKRVNVGREFELSEEAFEACKKRRRLSFEEEDGRKKRVNVGREFELRKEAFEDCKKRLKLKFEEKNRRKKRVNVGREFELSEEAFEACKERRKLSFEEEDGRKKRVNVGREFELRKEAFEACKKRLKLSFEEEDDRKKRKILTQEGSIEDDLKFEPSEEAFEVNNEYSDPTNIDGEKQTDSWSWLFLCLGLCFLFPWAYFRPQSH